MQENIIKVVNTVIFKRINNKDIKGYKVFVNEGNNKYLLKYINNPENPAPILFKTEKECSYSGDIQLEDNVYYDDLHKIKVYVQNNEITDFFYNDSTKILTLNNEEDYKTEKTFKIEYYLDSLKIEHTTSNHCTYEIIADINEGYKTGNHNILI